MLVGLSRFRRNMHSDHRIVALNLSRGYHGVRGSCSVSSKVPSVGRTRPGVAA